jgi:pimeloyl-ACP methyl ester carboxylesterase
VFILHGDRDRQISPDHAHKLEAALKGNSSCEVAKFKGLDHLFMESEEGEISRYADDRVVDSGFLKFVVDALKRTVKP